jgi:hypothetical protein
MDPPDPEPQPRPVPEGRRKKELTRDQRTQIVSRLLFELQTHGVDGKFARGTITAVRSSFMCVRKQLGGCGSVPSQTFGIRTFDNFAQAPKNAIVVVPESGTIRTFDIREAREANFPFSERNHQNPGCCTGHSKIYITQSEMRQRQSGNYPMYQCSKTNVSLEQHELL